VRGAIDMVAVATSLADLRAAADGEGYPALLLDAAIVALSARIALDETSDRTPEQVIRELWEDLLVLGPQRAATGAKSIDLPNPI
jgi:MoxR-like ATPase